MELVVPKRRGLTIAEALRLEKSKEVLCGGSGTCRCPSRRGRSPKTPTRARWSRAWSAARARRKRASVASPRRKPSPLCGPPSTSLTTPRPPPWIPSAVPPSRSGRDHHLFPAAPGAGKSVNRRRRPVPPPPKRELGGEGQPPLADTPAADDSDDDSDDDLALAALLPAVKRGQHTTPSRGTAAL